MQNTDKLRSLIQKLVGEPITVNCDRFDELTFLKMDYHWYSQFNEILLLLGFDRITQSFFQYLVNQDIEYKKIPQ